MNWWTERLVRLGKELKSIKLADEAWDRRVGELFELREFAVSRYKSVKSEDELKQLEEVCAEVVDGFKRLVDKYQAKLASYRQRERELERIKIENVVRDVLKGINVPEWVIRRFSFKSASDAKLYALAALSFHVKFVGRAKPERRKGLWKIFTQQVQESG